MRYARIDTLRQLSDLLGQIRLEPGIEEKRTGIFYRNSRSFLHFHEDPAAVFADIGRGTGSDFDRYPVNTIEQRKMLLAAIDRALNE
jgi:hypothetical protein